MVVLTKSALLNGAKHAEKVELESVGGEIYLRPLTQAEVNVYESYVPQAMGTFETNEKRGRRKGTDINTSGKVNLAKTSSAQAEAEAYAVATSMTCKDEEWTEEDVKGLDRVVFKEIFEHVKRLSGIEEEDLEEIEEFLENR